MLRASGHNVEAEAALQAVTRIDPAFAEAWYNLDDLLDDQGPKTHPAAYTGPGLHGPYENNDLSSGTAVRSE
jgi:hypothetical protein